MAKEQGYTMKVVARRTGLSPHVVRVWEKRYGAVTPSRSQTRRRLYTDAEIQRLILLRRATLAGHSIGQIANLSTERLQELVAEAAAASPPGASQAPSHVNTATAQPYLEVCLAAVQRLDAAALETALMRARVALSPMVFLEALIVPLMETIGAGWREGALRVMHEHLASATVRTLLGGLTAPADLPLTAPSIIVTTPTGQLHEIGALIAASIASAEGWCVTYLGPNLPAEDIAAAVQQEAAQVVGLSIVYPPDDPHLRQELSKLRRYIGHDIMICVSGRAAAAYDETLECIAAIRPHDLAEFRRILEALRTGNRR